VTEVGEVGRGEGRERERERERGETTVRLLKSAHCSGVEPQDPVLP